MVRPPLHFGQWDDAAVLHVVRNMRRRDHDEVYATRFEVDSYAFYRDLAAARPSHLVLEVVWPDLMAPPAAVFGVAQISPGVGVAHLVGTDRLSARDLVTIARRVREVWIPELLDAGLHRVQADALSTYTLTRNFLRRCGARREGERKALGKNGEDFTTYVWLKKEIEHV
jgi:hypothetical protein